MAARARAHASKVEAQSGDARVVQGLSRAKHSLGVHRTAVKGMGVTDDAGSTGRAGRHAEDGLQVSMGCGNVQARLQELSRTRLPGPLSSFARTRMEFETPL